MRVVALEISFVFGEGDLAMTSSGCQTRVERGTAPSRVVGDEVCPGTFEWRSGVSSRRGRAYPTAVALRPHAMRFVTPYGRCPTIRRTIWT